MNEEKREMLKKHYEERLERYLPTEIERMEKKMDDLVGTQIENDPILLTYLRILNEQKNYYTAKLLEIKKYDSCRCLAVLFGDDLSNCICEG